MAGEIVVGVDGSPASQAALRWAAEEAALRQTRLVAIWAWTFVPPAPIAEPGMIPMPAVDYTGTVDAERSAVEQEFDEALEAALPGVSGIEVERKLVEGDPAEVLESESKEAELLVVGSRGRSGIAAALLGSVSRHVVDHAVCPVVVVKAPPE